MNLSMDYPKVLQTQDYRLSSEGDEERFDLFPTADQYFSPLHKVRQQLDAIRQEAEEAYHFDNEIDPVPDSAYDEALSLLERLFHSGVSMPDIGWAEDGSLGFEWRPEGGIATMGIYGDNLVIYTVFFGEKRQVEGICTLSDIVMLVSFLYVGGFFNNVVPSPLIRI